MENKKNILVNINKGYIPHFLTMLNSLSLSNLSSQFDVYVMYTSLDESDMKDITSKVQPNINIIFKYVDNTLFKKAPQVKRYPYEIYYRIFAPVLLPLSVQRVLYLDCDLIVHGNIDELYNMDFDGNFFIACTQIGKFMQWFNRVRLSAKKGFVYMNTGVMLMDVENLRFLIDAMQIFEYIKKNGWRMCLYDQDVLYHFFGNKIKLVDRRVYNLSDRCFKRLGRRKKTRIDLEWVEKNNVIIHYLGPNKPWKKGYKGTLGEYYRRYQVK